MDAKASAAASATATETTTSAKPGQRTSVIWAIVFPRGYIKKIHEHTPEEIHYERQLLYGRWKNATAKEEPGDEDEPADKGESDDEGERAEDEPAANNDSSEDNYNCIRRVNINYDDVKIVCPNGTELSGQSKGTYMFLIKSDGNKPKSGLKDVKGSKKERNPTPRLSIKNDMEWAPIAQTAQPYPADLRELDERDGVKSHSVGPAASSKRLLCDIDVDIFVIDRLALSSIERRPRGVERTSDDVDIFSSEKRSDRWVKERANVEGYLLEARNVAFNVNDPGSILIYYDLMMRAAQSSDRKIRELVHDKPRTVTFFSGPETCDHKDCNKWRAKHQKALRPPGAQKVMGYKWWMFANFCVRSRSELIFRDEPHARDVTETLPVANAFVRHARTWSHALLNHHLLVPLELRTGFRIIRPPGLFGLLVNNRGCLNQQRVEDPAERERINAQIDPENDKCIHCNRKGFDLKHFTDAPLPKRPETGIMYLHYKEDKGKGKEGDSSEDEENAASTSKNKGKAANTSEAKDKGEAQVTHKAADISSNGDDAAGAPEGEGNSAATLKGKGEGTDNAADGLSDDDDWNTVDIDSSDDTRENNDKGAFRRYEQQVPHTEHLQVLIGWSAGFGPNVVVNTRPVKSPTRPDNTPCSEATQRPITFSGNLVNAGGSCHSQRL
ncbi:hypothetical protein F5Y06DRAFT_290537 [Hypoxylon sp. FL0890]|nr:hypothetical protein F5Y06DRAFT_290537 [Hypoxylon sp. FL0890]